MMPRRVSGSAICALDAKTRKVVESASSRPPPRASEETALMVGRGRVERVVRVARRVVRKVSVLWGMGEGG